MLGFKLQFICSPIIGSLSDKYGRRPVILISCAGLSLDYVLMALAPNLWWLALGRVLSGITAASISTAFAYIADVVTPENLALAVNLECDACVAFASAYQWVLTTGGPVYFTAEGSKRLAELRERLRELLRSDPTPEQLQAELAEIKNEVADILATQVVAAGGPKNEDPTTTEGTTTAPPETTTGETTTDGSTTTTP